MKLTFKSKVFLALSIAILIIDICYILLNYTLEKETLNKNLINQGENLESSYQLLMSQEQETMLAIATFVANDPEVAELFYQGKQAIEQEGGGKGKERAAAIRKQLFNKVAPAWQEVQNSFSARQLHFHLGPGSTSFLRVHNDKKYGDTMHDIRHIIVDANRDKHALSGLETGRIYSGIRGVVPVYFTDKINQQRIHVGSLEVGTSFDSLLDTLDNEFDLGIAVLFTAEHIDNLLWEDAKAKRFGSKLNQCNCYLEAISRDNATDFITSITSETVYNQTTVKQSEIAGKHYAITYIPVRDYLGHKDPSQPDIGNIVLWRNIDEQINAFNESMTYNIAYGIIGFLLLEILIYFAVKLAVRSLENEVKHQANKLLKNSWELNLADKIIENLREGIIITDEDAAIVRINQAVADITGYKKDELLGQNPNILSSNTQPNEFYESMWQQLDDKGYWQGEIWNRRKDGEFFAESLTITAVKDESAQVRNYVSVFSDVTQQAKQRQHLEKAAFFDTLTGLPNRMLLADRLAQAIELAKRNNNLVACVFIDLDKFKPVNDSYGHQAGDHLLVTLAARMSTILRKQDTLARIGGDEFVAVIGNLTEQEACLTLIERLNAEILNPVKYQDDMLCVSASIGISFYDPMHDISAETLQKQADKAMYKAKELGRNGYQIFTDSMMDN
ncbi:diguanylate cyclase [Pseudoalteromonas sp.]|uniref:diguanylate cyclase domain-containing protein n=1 Tax=Pseudoalteromonas sp. TaxID=53249 RepID=UPI0025810FC3|nr:diguanylate cyclase [Pseudoalteromonas sp.]